MKIVAYETRGDEKLHFDRLKIELGLEIIDTGIKLTHESLAMAEGAYGVSILGQSAIDRAIIDQLVAMEVRHISTRTIGINHIDVAYAREKGMLVSNASYPPDCVAEFTVMLMLLTLRKYKAAMFRGNVNDYSLNGLQGREIKHSTVGVIGTGSIGKAVIKLLHGFGARILAYSPTGKKDAEIEKQACLVDLETLYRESDIVSLHIPLLESTLHFIDKEAIRKMKEGVTIINCSRGELIEINALIEGIESRKIAALGLDVFEDETDIYHQDRRLDIISNRNMAYLRQFPNVVMTQHMAFYTDTTIQNMVRYSLERFII